MARIRTIKPEFWTSTQVVECSPTARLLFIGMWNFCDDYGNIPANCKQLKMQIFPGDTISAEVIAEYVEELKKNELIIEYQGYDNKTYWHVTGWKHQKIDKITQKHPKIGEDSPTTRRPLANSSPPEGNGMDIDTEGSGMAHDIFPESGSLVLDHEQTKQELSTSDQWKEDLMREYKINSLDELNEMLSQFLKESKLDGKYPRKLSDTKNHFRNVLKSGKRFKPPEPEVSEEFKQRQKQLMPTI